MKREHANQNGERRAAAIAHGARASAVELLNKANQLRREANTCEDPAQRRRLIRSAELMLDRYDQTKMAADAVARHQ